MNRVEEKRGVDKERFTLKVSRRTKQISGGEEVGLRK